MSALLTGWLLDTFLFTGALIVLVLLLRQPVARHCGPQVAYALWALPLLRFLLPPIVLPASMAPAVPGAAMTAPLAVLNPDGAANGSVAAPGVSEVLVLVWLGGALLFLARRLIAYRRMRRALLAEARPVGEAGAVRLVETPAVRAPVAFGVRDKVVALPPEFMALPDRAARDLAIAHELAHHRGRDLLANILAQPVLALHWFNPLAWLGWRAMRKDQEAACDARVVAGKGRAERAVYASVIAGFATGDDLELAAAMACPVLGEKSIIHRLRSLTQGDVSATRRRLGTAAIAAGALVLPLTGSISFAQAGEGGPAAHSGVPQPIDSFDPGPSAAGRADPLAEMQGEGQREADDAERQKHLPEEQLEQAMTEREYATEMMEPELEIAHEAAERALEEQERWIERAEEARRDPVAIATRATAGLRSARAALAANRGIPADARDHVLRSLDREIERIEGRQHALAASHAAAPGAIVVVPEQVPEQGAELRFAFAWQGEAQVVSVRWSRSLPSPPLPPAPPPAPIPSI